jgi:hypothetical protein
MKKALQNTFPDAQVVFMDIIEPFCQTKVLDSQPTSLLNLALINCELSTDAAQEHADSEIKEASLWYIAYNLIKSHLYLGALITGLNPSKHLLRLPLLNLLR